MTWITPVTDWVEGDRCSFQDMNRIAGNVNYLHQNAQLKADYTANDFVTVAEWSAILIALAELRQATFLQEETHLPGADMIAGTFNEVEELTLAIYERIGKMLAQKPANIYAGDDICTSTIPENYVRGVI